jgi:hypothetical protein
MGYNIGGYNMIEYTAKNWAGFYESLRTRYEAEELKLKSITDPYEQWKIKENLKIISNATQKYVDYLKEIGSDHGFRYLRFLEVELHKALKANKDEVYRTKLELYNILYTEFKNFRVAP